MVVSRAQWFHSSYYEARTASFPEGGACVSARLGASVNDILTLAALAAHDLSEERAEKAAE